LNVAGGTTGVKLIATCASNTGMNGSTGSLVINYTFMESGTLSGCGVMVLNANWLYFRINTSANDVLLQWAVTNITNSYFLVERRKEESWLAIGQIPAVANKFEYSLRDLHLTPGTYQYRLKLVTNQKISYSSIQQITIKGSGQVIRYNSLTQQVFVQGSIDKDDLLRIFDFSGKCIYQKRFVNPSAGWQLTTSFLKNGTYIVKTAKASTKFIVTSQ
jgi:hypothetical protein